MTRRIFLLLCAILLLAVFLQPVPQTAHARAVTYQAKAYIFLRTPGPFGFGHVGWGYEVRTYTNGRLTNTTYYYGAVENPGGQAYVPPGGNNGGWWATASTGQTMYNAMKNRGYQSYKFVANFYSVTSTNINNAYNYAINMPNRGYNVTGNNCMNASYDVLTAIRAPNVAWPSTNWTPTGWYNNTSTGWSSSRSIP
jgi:hypothetical protein